MLNQVRNDFKQLAFVAKFIFKPKQKELQVIKCIMGNSNNALKMADTDNFPEIINDIHASCITSIGIEKISQLSEELMIILFV